MRWGVVVLVYTAVVVAAAACTFTLDDVVLGKEGTDASILPEQDSGAPNKERDGGADGDATDTLDPVGTKGLGATCDCRRDELSSDGAECQGRCAASLRCILDGNREQGRCLGPKCCAIGADPDAGTCASPTPCPEGTCRNSRSATPECAARCAEKLTTCGLDADAGYCDSCPSTDVAALDCFLRAACYQLEEGEAISDVCERTSDRDEFYCR